LSHRPSKKTVLLYFSLYGERWKYSLWEEKHILVKMKEFSVGELYIKSIEFPKKCVINPQKHTNLKINTPSLQYNDYIKRKNIKFLKIIFILRIL